MTITVEVVRGGGETIRKIVVVSALSFMVALMVAQPVSAEVLTTYVTDAEGDVPYLWDSQTGEAMTAVTNGNQKWCEYGYFDMTSYWLSQDLDPNTYMFGVNLADEFPQVGDDMPPGVKRIDWIITFDRQPFNWILSPETTTEYMVNLTFDGQYSCNFVEYIQYFAGNIMADLDICFEGASFWTSFSGDLMGDFVEFYWTVLIRVVHGGNSCNFADWSDWYAADGQIWDSIPWPPV